MYSSFLKGGSFFLAMSICVTQKYGVGIPTQGFIPALRYVLRIFMSFPVTFHLFGYAISAHLLCEVIAYTVGFQVYRALRRKERLERRELLLILLAATTGAFLGSKF